MKGLIKGKNEKTESKGNKIWNRIRQLVIDKDADKLKDLLKEYSIDLDDYGLLSIIREEHGTFKFVEKLAGCNTNLVEIGFYIRSHFCQSAAFDYFKESSTINFDELFQRTLIDVDTYQFITVVEILLQKKEFTQEVKLNYIKRLTDYALSLDCLHYEGVFESGLIREVKNQLNEKRYEASLKSLEENLINAFFDSKRFDWDSMKCYRNQLLGCLDEFYADTINLITDKSAVIKETNDIVLYVAKLLEKSNDRSVFLHLATSLKERNNLDCIYNCIVEIQKSEKYELRNYLTDELIDFIANKRDLVCCFGLIKYYKTISETSLKRLFAVIMDEYNIDIKGSRETIKASLTKFVEIKVLDGAALYCYMEYLSKDLSVISNIATEQGKECDKSRSYKVGRIGSVSSPNNPPNGVKRKTLQRRRKTLIDGIRRM